ncbi:MAG: hypothetical protein WEG36_15730 [Gemmatimonadota bacterium]
MALFAGAWLTSILLAAAGETAAQDSGRGGGLALGDGLAFGVGAGIGAASTHFHLPRHGEDWRIGPVLGARFGAQVGPVPLWLIADYQAFHASGERENVRDFRTLYVLALAEFPFGAGSLQLGGGPVFYDYEGLQSPTDRSRKVGFAVGASVSRALSSRLQLELGIRTGRAAGVQSYLLALQLAHYWGVADPRPGPGR